MKRTLLCRLLETIALIFAWPIAIGFCICYVVACASLDLGCKIIGVWSES